MAEYYEEPPEMTTLSVPKKFRKILQKEYEGRNDLQRLKNWAEDYSEEKAYGMVQQYVKTEDFEEIVTGIIRNKLITYNTGFREDFEEAVEETVRDMQRSR